MKNKKSSKEKWFKEAVEQKPPYELGWKKEMPQGRRRATALKSRPKSWTKHKRYISTAQALQALSNVSQDTETKKLAKSDAHYFFEKAKSYSGSMNKGGDIDELLNVFYIVVDKDERGEYGATYFSSKS